MRAIVARKPGGPEVLEIVETAEPEVRDGEVKISRIGVRVDFFFVGV